MFDYEKIYIPENAPGEADALDYMYDYIDDALQDGRTQEVIEILNGIDYEKVSLLMLVGFLTITIPFASVLPNRNDVILKTYEKAKALGEDPEPLLKGLFLADGSSAAWGYNLLNPLMGRKTPAPG
jgi:hypothetical protein